MTYFGLDIPGPGCTSWSMKTSYAPARQCASIYLARVDVKGQAVLLCHTHRAEFQRTGVVRTKAMANKFYSTAQYRPAKSNRPQNVNLQGKKVW